MVSVVSGCCSVSRRLSSIRLKAAPFNVTIIQIYAQASGHEDNELDNFYQQLQEIIDHIPEKDILVVHGDLMLKLERMHKQPGKTYVDPNAMLGQMREVSDF